ncbi:hypothetical protein O181_060992 [Austropuccinia psidii MF-1]|uniref:Uncharacterized protein n=1 Tax=Austropuccinia psidii MF-1 TaxID=1389203 RepID=A0A9Q3HYY1_9BASI|nr:hypothetical protein [Austropuccinia psidii MF-1]
MTPWIRPLEEPKDRNKEKKEVEELIPIEVSGELKKQSLVSFTDGFLIPGKGGGAGAELLFNLENNKTIFIGKDDIPTNIEAELIRVNLAIQLIMEEF